MTRPLPPPAACPCELVATARAGPRCRAHAAGGPLPALTSVGDRGHDPSPPPRCRHRRPSTASSSPASTRRSSSSCGCDDDVGTASSTTPAAAARRQHSDLARRPRPRCMPSSGTDTGHVGDGPVLPGLDGSWALTTSERAGQLRSPARWHVVTGWPAEDPPRFLPATTKRLAYFRGCYGRAPRPCRKPSGTRTDFDGSSPGAPPRWGWHDDRLRLDEQAANAAALSVRQGRAPRRRGARSCDAKDV